MGVLSAVEHIFQRDCNARKSTGKQASGNGKQRKSWSQSEDKSNSEENQRKSKGTRGAQGKTHRKLVYEVLKTRNQRQVRKLRNLHRRVPLTILGFTVAGVLKNGIMTGVRLDGTKGTNV